LAHGVHGPVAAHLPGVFHAGIGGARSFKGVFVAIIAHAPSQSSPMAGAVVFDAIDMDFLVDGGVATRANVFDRMHHVKKACILEGIGVNTVVRNSIYLLGARVVQSTHVYQTCCIHGSQFKGVSFAFVAVTYLQFAPIAFFTGVIARTGYVDSLINHGIAACTDVFQTEYQVIRAGVFKCVFEYSAV